MLFRYLGKDSLILNCLFPLLVYEFGVTIPDYTFYLTTGITVALAWSLPDKPTYPEHQNNNHIMIQNKNDDGGGTVNSTLTTDVINTKSNATRPTHLKSNRNDIVNRITSYAEYYFQNRRPNSYYFGHGLRNNTNHHQYYTNNESGNSGSDIRPPYSTSTFYSKNPSHDAMYMIETYFKPWIKSLEIATKFA